MLEENKRKEDRLKKSQILRGVENKVRRIFEINLQPLLKAQQSYKGNAHKKIYKKMIKNSKDNKES